MGRIVRRLKGALIVFANWPRIFFYYLCSSCQTDGEKPRILQPLLCIGRGNVLFGSNVMIGIFPSPYFLTGVCYIEARNQGARVEIGSNTFINNEFTAIAETTSIKIGKHCLIGPRCTIFDSDFHGLLPDDRLDFSKVVRSAVEIEDNVFIGANVTILKGSHIGAGSVIAAGSIVSGIVPPYVVAGGAPARVIRKL